MTKAIAIRGDLTEQRLFAVVEQNTPDAIKSPLFPQDEPNAFTFQLDEELIERLNLWEWFGNYAKEAQVSTAGIRGPQNILYPWDTRFPINQIGIVLATLGKSLVANESAGGKPIEKNRRLRGTLQLAEICRIHRPHPSRTRNSDVRAEIIWHTAHLDGILLDFHA